MGWDSLALVLNSVFGLFPPPPNGCPLPFERVGQTLIAQGASFFTKPGKLDERREPVPPDNVHRARHRPGNCMDAPRGQAIDLCGLVDPAFSRAFGPPVQKQLSFQNATVMATCRDVGGPQSPDRAKDIAEQLYRSIVGLRAVVRSRFSPVDSVLQSAPAGVDLS